MVEGRRDYIWFSVLLRHLLMYFVDKKVVLIPRNLISDAV